MSSKYDNMMKCAQVRSLANEKQYRNAYEVIQTINIDQITAITDLNTIADVYIQLQKYAEAKGIYLKLYERFPTRRVVYQLVYLSLKCGEIEEAEEYYREYETLDKSGDRIILRYYIDKAKGVDRQTLIHHLQELKRVDYMEEWAYELAKLYHKEGMSEACVEECSDIILWFGEGLIVEKAMLLKHHYVEGADISSESAIIEETRNLAADLRIAAEIAERNEREAAQRAAEEEAVEQPVNEEEVVLTEEVVEASAEEAEAVEEALEESVQEEELKDTEQSTEEEQPEETPAYEEEMVEKTEEEVIEEETLPEETEEVEADEYQEEEAENDETELFEGGFSEAETAITEIVTDIKMNKSAGHMVITGSNAEKNIEIGKSLAKELYRQQVLPTSKIARITAASLNGVNLMDNRQQLEGGCLLIEEASEMTLDTIQSLYQLVRKAKGNLIVVLSDDEEAIEYLLKKNRKLGKMIEYHIEI